jgi:hypothetical protein
MSRISQAAIVLVFLLASYEDLLAYWLPEQNDGALRGLTEVWATVSFDASSLDEIDVTQFRDDLGKAFRQRITKDEFAAFEGVMLERALTCRVSVIGKSDEVFYSIQMSLWDLPWDTSKLAVLLWKRDSVGLIGRSEFSAESMGTKCGNLFVGVWLEQNREAAYSPPNATP